MRKGFTLIEILIATAIFMTVLVVAVGIFTSTIAGSSTSEQLRTTSQSARFVFESIIRDVRASHGLVYLGPDSKRHLVFPPFAVEDLNLTDKQILVYKAERQENPDVNGNNLYVITRNIYRAVPDAKGNRMTLTIQTTDPAGRTAVDLFAQKSNADIWTTTTTNQQPVDLLPSDLRADAFTVLHGESYKDNPDEQKVEPFIQLELTVVNKRFNLSTRKNGGTRTTLRTTIVPRDFTSPYEVEQSGLQGTVN